MESKNDNAVPLEYMRKQLDISSYLYYHKDEPTMTDVAWDRMFAHVRWLENDCLQKDPGYRIPDDSPTQTIGWDSSRPDPREIKNE